MLISANINPAASRRFRDLSENKYPLTLKIPENVDSDSDISDEDMEAAVMRLQVSRADRHDGSTPSGTVNVCPTSTHS